MNWLKRIFSRGFPVVVKTIYDNCLHQINVHLCEMLILENFETFRNRPVGETFIKKFSQKFTQRRRTFFKKKEQLIPV